MTLRRRLTRGIGLMIAGVLLLGMAAVVGVRGLHQDFGVALRANEQTREIYSIGAHVAAARSYTKEIGTGQALIEMQAALAGFDIAQNSQWMDGTTDAAADLHASLLTATDALRQGNGGDSLLNETYASLANLAAATRHIITERQAAADQRHRIVLTSVIALSGVIAAIAIVVAIRLYKSVLGPLLRLQESVKKVAAGNLDERLPVDGDEELATLAGEFNRMAGELKSVHDDLERRIEMKSRELVRSERLASVGYLAAGVAHEINNPLGIIAGYGERSLQRLDRDRGDETIGYVRKAITVMCNESFRCKEITDRLLLLSRPGDNAKRRVTVAELANEVVASVGALKRFADRRIVMESPRDEELCIFANEGELRQVILNLVINALEAVAPETGEVRVSAIREKDDVVVTVRDNGRGMTSETAARVFEPFFTEKRGERAGTGLGLSVAHAIVSEHGGRMSAFSDGPGRGSCFTVRLPVAEEVCHAGDR
jgi:two-component system, NtrC family, sensor kinase